VRHLERAQRAQVEDRAQVDVEALGPLAGEHQTAALERMDRLIGECGVIGCAAHPDVDRRHQKVGAEQLRFTIRAPQGDRVELGPVPVRAVDRACQSVDRG